MNFDSIHPWIMVHDLILMLMNSMLISDHYSINCVRLWIPCWLDARRVEWTIVYGPRWKFQKISEPSQKRHVIEILTHFEIEPSRFLMHMTSREKCLIRWLFGPSHHTPRMNLIKSGLHNEFRSYSVLSINHSFVCSSLIKNFFMTWRSDWIEVRFPLTFKSIQFRCKTLVFTTCNSIVANQRYFKVFN